MLIRQSNAAIVEPGGVRGDFSRLPTAVLPRHPDIIGRFQHSMHGSVGRSVARSIVEALSERRQLSRPHSSRAICL